MTSEKVLNTMNLSQSIARSGSSLTDSYIRGREILLNKIAGVNERSVVNQNGVTSHIQPSADLANKLKQTLDDLKLSVMEGDGTSVNYQALQTSAAYANYHEECLSVLDGFDPEMLPSNEARQAFWINLYNALVMDGVITQGIRNSVTEGLLGNLTFFRRAAYSVNGQRVSLEDIEHGILRGNRGNPYVPGVHFSAGDRRFDWALPLDPRIHFTLNCGGRSCPPIRSYSPDNLNEQLEIASRSFVNGTVQTDPTRNQVSLSKIFRWYQSDFGGRDGVLNFLIHHLPDGQRREFLEKTDGNPNLRYTPYDWSLNGI